MPGVTFAAAKTLERNGWNARDLTIYSHAGTHMDAPVHFGVEGPTIDQFMPQQLIADCHVIDVEVNTPSAEIRLSDIGSVDGRLQPGEGLLIRTGWSQHLGKACYRDELPRISEELAAWCAAMKVSMLGVEPPSIADVNNLKEVSRIHEILLSAEVLIIEGLTNLWAIKNEKVTVIALPLKIEGGDGAPARVIAIE